MSESVILVDRNDSIIGIDEKRAAHRSGALHRAFSIFIFDTAGRMLLQRRALAKYHSGGLWSNACCSHPRPGESTAAAAYRRLPEEMGFRCELRPAFSFVYRADVGAGLIEHEYDHVFIGTFDGEPHPVPAEVEAWRRIAIPALRGELRDSPGRFTFWFRIAFRELTARGLLPAPTGATGSGGPGRTLR